MGIEPTEKECGRWKNTETRCDGGVAEWGDVMGEVIRSAVMTSRWQGDRRRVAGYEEEVDCTVEEGRKMVNNC